MKTALTLSAVSHYFDDNGNLGRILVLDNLTFEVGCGQLTAIVGPSGCGKTTLLNIIAGIIVPSAGRIINTAAPARGGNRYGYVFQNASLIPWRNVRNNAVYGAEIAGVTLSELKARTVSLLSSHGLRGYENAFPKALSGGMQQRVSIIRAVLSGAKVILLDEPFSNSDYLMRRDLQVELSRLLDEEHLTAILVTHDVEEAVRIGDKIIVLTPKPARIKAEINITIPRSERLKGGASVMRELSDYVDRVESEFVSAATPLQPEQPA